MDSTPTSPPVTPAGEAIPGATGIPVQPVAGAAREKSYGQIVKSSALIGGATLILFLNLTATFYSVARWFFLRDTGRKLLHIDRQLATDDAVIEDLRSNLKS